MAYQREGNAQNQNCESGKAPEEPVALLQAAKACKGHWVNKFGHWPVRTAPRRSYVFPAAVNTNWKTHKHEVSCLTTSKNGDTIASPKEIVESRFLRGLSFLHPFPLGLIQ